MLRSLVTVVASSLLAGTTLAQTPEPGEARMKTLWEYCQNTLKGSPSKEGCHYLGEMRSWRAMDFLESTMEKARTRPIPPPTTEELALRDFCEKRMGGFPTSVGCMKNSAFTDWPDVAKRMKAEAGVKYPTVEPGQWKLTFTNASMTSNEPGFDTSKMKPPPELNKCITSNEVSDNLVALLLGRTPTECEYVKNSGKDGALDVELKCESREATGKITAKGMITLKKFHLDYAAAFDGAGKETGKKFSASYVVAGEWQSATCKQ